jgi:predicted RNA-binding protein
MFSREMLSMENCWIFVSYPYSEFNAGTISEMEQELRKNSKWPIGKRTPHRKQLCAGDKVIFYQAGEEGKKFVGCGELFSNLQFDENQKFDFVSIANIELFGKPIPINKLLETLSFIHNERCYGHHFQGGIVKIPEEDYRLIMRRAHQSKAKISIKIKNL